MLRPQPRLLSRLEEVGQGAERARPEAALVAQAKKCAAAAPPLGVHLGWTEVKGGLPSSPIHLGLFS